MILTLPKRNLLISSIALSLCCSAYALPPCAAPFHPSPIVKKVGHKVSNADYQLLMDRINAHEFTTYTPEQVQQILAKYSTADNGSYTDIKYELRTHVSWEPGNHLENLKCLATVYIDPKSEYYGSKDIYHKIVKGLDHWNKVRPYSTNWWHNQIGEPNAIGIILIKMRYGKKRVPEELEQRLFARMIETGGYPGKGPGATGVNRTQVSTHWLYRGLLTRDEAVTRLALDNIFNAVKYTTREGFQYDSSYFQHGCQLMIQGYGGEMISSISTFANYVAGTRFAIDQEKKDIISRFSRETYYQCIRGDHFPWNVLGRGLGDMGGGRTGNYETAERLMALDPEHKKEYKSFVKRIKKEKPADYKVKPSHTHYFNGDFTHHVRPEYSFSVRMVSNRTIRNEWGNGSNYQGYFLSDGSTCIMRTGQEYDMLFGAWNWTQMPGITAPQMRPIPLAGDGIHGHDWITPGTSRFSGGVSDSLYGASAYTYFDKYQDKKIRHTPRVNTGANKSWFFFDREVVCLGTVTSTSDFPVQTTVNQCNRFDEDIWMNDGKQTAVVSEGEYKDAKARWVLHNHIGYVFPQGGNVWLNNHEQRGNWRNTSDNNPDKECRQKVFAVGFDHSAQPVDEPYAYIVVPTVGTVKEMEKYQKKQAVDIVSNTKSLQAVHHKGLHIWQAIFFEPGTLQHKGVSITTDHSCALMLKRGKKNRCVLHVADPGQRLQPITLTICIDGRTRQTITAHFEHLSQPFAGKTLSYTLY